MRKKSRLCNRVPAQHSIKKAALTEAIPKAVFSFGYLFRIIREKRDRMIYASRKFLSIFLPSGVSMDSGWN